MHLADLNRAIAGRVEMLNAIFGGNQPGDQPGKKATPKAMRAAVRSAAARRDPEGLQT